MTLADHQADDATLLRRYADEKSDEAFAELVRRYIALVHSAALRQVGGNTATAVDVTQSVFTELARHVDRLAHHPALTGWLYTTTHRIAARHVRSEIRRQRREKEAHAMQKLLPESAAEPPLTGRSSIQSSMMPCTISGRSTGWRCCCDILSNGRSPKSAHASA
jgi:DNA-directed RNA polymerase specialized sigma24 family protein